MGSCTSNICHIESKPDSLQSMSLSPEENERINQSGGHKSLNHSISANDGGKKTQDKKNEDQKKISRFSKTSINDSQANSPEKKYRELILPLDINIEEKLREKEEKKKRYEVGSDKNHESNRKDERKSEINNDNSREQEIENDDLSLIIKSDKNIDIKKKKNPQPASVSSIGTKDNNSTRC
jgi:hypothetical protein